MPDSPFKIGTRIKHRTWGEGTVYAVSTTKVYVTYPGRTISSQYYLDGTYCSLDNGVPRIVPVQDNSWIWAHEQ